MKEITLSATVESIPQLTAWMDEELERLGCPMKAQMQLDIALDEIFSNIAHYAYPPGEGKATVQLAFDEAGRTVIMTFLDRGMPYDPMKKPDPDVSLSMDKRDIGGLGIFLVKKTMDGMSYRYEDGCNVLEIRKKIG